MQLPDSKYIDDIERSEFDFKIINKKALFKFSPSFTRASWCFASPDFRCSLLGETE